MPSTGVCLASNAWQGGMFPVFSAGGSKCEEPAALLLLRDRLSSGRAELPFLEEVGGFLERRCFDHRLNFRAGAA